jgi:hypothetical protein
MSKNFIFARAKILSLREQRFYLCMSKDFIFMSKDFVFMSKDFVFA